MNDPIEEQLQEAMHMIFDEPSSYMTLGEVTFDNCHLVAQWWLKHDRKIATALALEILAQKDAT